MCLGCGGVGCGGIITNHSIANLLWGSSVEELRK